METVRPTDPEAREIVSDFFSYQKADPRQILLKNGLDKQVKQGLARYMQKIHIRDTLRLIVFLNKAGVDYVVLKGITLTYYDLSRKYWDVDILVSKNDAEEVANLLIKEFNYFYARPEQLKFLKDPNLSNAHDIALANSRLIPVEIHYRLFNYLPHDESRLLADKSYLVMDNVKIPCQSKEMQLLVVLLHNIYHHFFVFCDQKKWIGDINIIVKNYHIDWVTFARMLDGLGQKEIVYLALRVLSRNPEARLELPPAAMTCLKPASWRSYLKKTLFLWACYFAWDRLFPPKDVLVQRFHLKPDSFLFPLVYPANWVRLFAVLALMAFEKLGRAVSNSRLPGPYRTAI
jgi:hypothetical protein